MKGLFISFEGGEAVGKTTQIRLLQERLFAQNIQHIITREPGGTAFGETLRQILVSSNRNFSTLSELLLHYASRYEHLSHKIWPALKKNHWVISDRFADSSFVYQGILQGMAEQKLEQLHNWVTDNFWPDLTFLLDMPATKTAARLTVRSQKNTDYQNGKTGDYYDALNIDSHEKIRQAFLARAHKFPQRFIICQAEKKPQDLAQDIWSKLQPYL